MFHSPLLAPADPMIDVERAVIGAIMVRNERYAPCRAVGLQAEHFTILFHGELFRTIGELIAAGEEASPFTLATRFANHPYMRDKNCAAMLGSMATASQTMASVAEHARLIRTQAARRDVADLAHELYQSVHDHSRPLTQVVGEMRAALDQALQGEAGSDGNGDFEPLSAAIGRAIELAVQARERGGIDGASWGLAALDRITGGIARGDLAVLAGRPGMGKSALGVAVARHNALAGKRVGLFSLEMSSEQVAMRELALPSGVGADRLRVGQFGEPQLAALLAAQGQFDGLPLMLDKGPARDPASMLAKLQRNPGFELVVVDYLQHMHSAEPTENKVQEVSAITRDLKMLAREARVPVLVLSQLNRGPEYRDDHRPMLADLRDSGAIEQDADCVVLLYRSEYYLQSAEPADPRSEEHAKWRERLSRAAGKTELIVAKNRHGACGSAVVGFEQQFTRFFDLELRQP